MTWDWRAAIDVVKNVKVIPIPSWQGKTMSEQKHTPGPWSIGQFRNRGQLHSFNEQLVRCGAPGVNGGQGNCIAIVHMGGKGALSNTPEDLDANARLIAAAPEMLIVLENLVQLVPEPTEASQGFDHPPDFANEADARLAYELFQARKIIAKAKDGDAPTMSG